MSSELCASLGAHVEIELVSRSGLRERVAFDIVPDAHADFEHGFLGAGTPLGQALQGRAAGETIPYQRGDVVEVKILKVSPAAGPPPDDTAEKRAEARRRARDQAELTNMVSFALAFDSKWGDYDPERIVNQYEEAARDKAEKDSPEGLSESEGTRES